MWGTMLLFDCLIVVVVWMGDWWNDMLKKWMDDWSNNQHGELETRDVFVCFLVGDRLFVVVGRAPKIGQITKTTKRWMWAHGGDRTCPHKSCLTAKLTTISWDALSTRLSDTMCSIPMTNDTIFRWTACHCGKFEKHWAKLGIRDPQTNLRCGSTNFAQPSQPHFTHCHDLLWMRPREWKNAAVRSIWHTIVPQFSPTQKFCLVLLSMFCSIESLRWI